MILNSGLDASSSLELLNHLNLVAESGRLVILTIHQPRLEIFHLFHKILFLCEGQVRYTITLNKKTFPEAFDAQPLSFGYRDMTVIVVYSVNFGLSSGTVKGPLTLTHLTLNDWSRGE